MIFSRPKKSVALLVLVIVLVPVLLFRSERALAQFAWPNLAESFSSSYFLPLLRMPLTLTRLEKRIIAVLALLIVLGLAGMSVL